jgi:chaperonin GroES
MKPLNDRVLLRRVEEESDKQVQVADAYRPKSNMGVVLAAGEKVNGALKEGDKVLFGEYSAQDIEINGENLVLICVHDIWVRL